MAFSGVRSSWDMLARNSDLCWLATSSWRLLSASSRKSRLEATAAVVEVVCRNLDKKYRPIGLLAHTSILRGAAFPRSESAISRRTGSGVRLGGHQFT